MHKILRIRRIAATFAMAFMLAFTPTVSVLADNASSIAQFVENNAPVQNSAGTVTRGATEEWNKVAGNFSISSDGLTNPVGVTFTFAGNSATYYYSADNSDAIASAIGASTTNQTIDMVNDITADLNIKADTAGAAGVVGGFVPIVNVIVGIGVLAVILLLLMYTMMDVLFLAFPVFRTFSQNQLQNGKSNAMVKTNSSGEAQYRFISDDAVRAYQQSIVEGGNKQPYIKYLLSRAWAYIALATITVVLLTGNYGVFLNIGIKIGEGIIDMVNSIGSTP